MTLEKDSRKWEGPSVCPVGTGAHRDTDTGFPRAGGGAGRGGREISRWGCRVNVLLRTVHIL